jgi:hypothetical protein
MMLVWSALLARSLKVPLAIPGLRRDVGLLLAGVTRRAMGEEGTAGLAMGDALRAEAAREACGDNASKECCEPSEPSDVEQPREPSEPACSCFPSSRVGGQKKLAQWVKQRARSTHDQARHFRGSCCGQ